MRNEANKRSKLLGKALRAVPEIILKIHREHISGAISFCGGATLTKCVLRDCAFRVFRCMVHQPGRLDFGISSPLSGPEESVIIIIY